MKMYLRAAVCALAMCMAQSAMAQERQQPPYQHGGIETTFQTTVLYDAFRFADRLIETNQMEKAWSVRTEGSRGWDKMDGNATHNGFSTEIWDGMLGVEHVQGDWLFGGGAGFSRADIQMHSSADFGKVDSINAGGYASYRPGLWSITATVVGGLHDIEGKRTENGAAYSSFEAQSVGAGLEVSRRIPTECVLIEPMVGVNYSFVQGDSYHETGGATDLIAARGSLVDSLKGYAGTRLYRTFPVGETVAITPELRARALYDFLDDRRGFSATDIGLGTPVTVSGIRPAQLAALVGAGVDVRLTPNWRLKVGYDAEIRSNELGHFVSGSATFQW